MSQPIDLGNDSESQQFCHLIRYESPICNSNVKHFSDTKYTDASVAIDYELVASKCFNSFNKIRHNQKYD